MNILLQSGTEPQLTASISAAEMSFLWPSGLRHFSAPPPHPSLSRSRWRMEQFWVESVLDSSGMRIRKPSRSSCTLFSRPWMCACSSPLQPCTSASTSYIRLFIWAGSRGHGGWGGGGTHARRQLYPVERGAFTCLSHLVEVHQCAALIGQNPLLHLDPSQPGEAENSGSVSTKRFWWDTRTGSWGRGQETVGDQRGVTWGWGVGRTVGWRAAASSGACARGSRPALWTAWCVCRWATSLSARWLQRFWSGERRQRRAGINCQGSDLSPPNSWSSVFLF